ncbi:M15 family metallopeptidase [Akkermansia sp. N21169]|jgi:peptidoglycan hydrolase-like protein with peptidoglycan-binding domain|uniref:M15 family metallopeptidase n=1 Tax=Akkermansia sp. N21169 TaxID=3040765 RepID=UPI00244EAB75|nr:M15 family metallopeptidase [Akkermansia sp. N21169]MDH3068037.1 M15 family metallopeptidase [Akkermansia sp. N21169]
MNWRTIQRQLGINADGIPGPKTAEAIAKILDLPQGNWNDIQTDLGLDADGIPGDKTLHAVAEALNLESPSRHWPTQAEVRSGKSIFGQPGTHLVTIRVPYPLKLSWDTGTSVEKITCHEQVADAITSIFQQTKDAYGIDRISALGLDLYGGCYSNRAIVGGKSLSMHAFGIAIDLDPDHNGLNTHAPKARFSSPEYDTFWKIVESEGGISLGRERDYDWMHFQFSTLS